MIAIVVLTWNTRVLLIHILQLNNNSLWVAILLLNLCIAKFHGGKQHVLRAGTAILFLRWNNWIVSSLRLGDVILKLITIFMLWNVNWRFVSFDSIPFQDFMIIAMWTIMSLLFVFEKLVSNGSVLLFREILSLFTSVDAKSWYSSISFSSGLSKWFSSSFV